MARHLAAGAVPPPALRGDALPAPAAPDARPGRRASGIGVGAAFGTFTAAQLRAVADAAGRDGVRVTPFRLLYLPGTDAAMPRCDDLLTDPHDPLLRVRACIGAPVCPQARAVTREAARAIAPLLADGMTAHVSGCAKGCAHPGPADLTLVGRAGAFDVVADGAAWDVPQRRGVAAARLAELFGA
ncbi:hypothetical protein [Oceaniovalibus guishaninsula]|nr:hypothetical protein [Oceaniovalibus guishaninsula]